VDVDYSAGLQLKGLAEFLDARSVTVGLVRGDDAVAGALHTYEVIGTGSRVLVFPRLEDGMSAYRADRPVKS